MRPTWKEIIRYTTQPIPKPDLIEPHRLIRQFESACETGHLSVPVELSQFAALYQKELGVAFESIEYLRTTQRPVEGKPSEGVLIPFSGGLSSSAALWKAMAEGREVWLFYMEGFCQGEAQERRSIRETMFNARDAEGCPLLYLNQGQMAARLFTLPAPQQLQRVGQKWHPHSIIALYTQVVNVMRAHNLSRVLWSGFYEQRPMLDALSRYFQRIEGQHQVEFAHTTRLEVLAELFSAQERSSYTQEGALTAGPTVGNIVQRCCSCSDISLPQLELTQTQVPSPLAGQCGNCSQCLPWNKLAIECSDLPAQRAVLGFGVGPQPAKPKAKRARAKAGESNAKRRKKEPESEASQIVTEQPSAASLPNDQESKPINTDPVVTPDTAATAGKSSKAAGKSGKAAGKAGGKAAGKAASKAAGKSGKAAGKAASKSGKAAKSSQ